MGANRNGSAKVAVAVVAIVIVVAAAIFLMQGGGVQLGTTTAAVGSLAYVYNQTPSASLQGNVPVMVDSALRPILAGLYGAAKPYSFNQSSSQLNSTYGIGYILPRDAATTVLYNIRNSLESMGYSFDYFSGPHMLGMNGTIDYSQCELIFTTEPNSMQLVNLSVSCGPSYPPGLIYDVGANLLQQGNYITSFSDITGDAAAQGAMHAYAVQISNYDTSPGNDTIINGALTTYLTGSQGAAESLFGTIGAQISGMQGAQPLPQIGIGNQTVIYQASGSGANQSYKEYIILFRYGNTVAKLSANEAAGSAYYTAPMNLANAYLAQLQDPSSVYAPVAKVGHTTYLAFDYVASGLGAVLNGIYGNATMGDVGNSGAILYSTGYTIAKDHSASDISSIESGMEALNYTLVGESSKSFGGASVPVINMSKTIYNYPCYVNIVLTSVPNEIDMSLSC